MMPSDLNELLLAFNEHGVRYRIVGGYAVGAHAEPRATKVSRSVNRQPESKISGMSFDEAWENRIEGLIDGEVSAPVISRDDLIRNKLAAARDQDILDVRSLRIANRDEPPAAD